MPSTATVTQHADTASPDSDPNPTVIPTLIRIAERFGLPVVILLLVLWWARTDVVQPLLDAHFGFIDKIVAGQEKHVDEVKELGKKLDKLIEITGQQ